MAANTNPASALHFTVKFKTTNLSNGELVNEPHTVSGPTGSFGVPLNAVTLGGSKIVVPLTSNVSQGAHYLKFHLPQPGSSVFYVTFATKNNSYSDGYYDWTTGIPEDYRADLRTFILDGTSVPIKSTTTKTKTLVFSVYGLDTNKASGTIQYTVKFQAKYGTTIITDTADTGTVFGPAVK